MLIFGLNAIACLFVIWSMGGLTWSRIKEPHWFDDVYFWLTAGSTLVGSGLLEFSLLRVYQSVVLDMVPFVQAPVAALSATSLILAGLSFKMRAIALSNKTAGWLFVFVSLVWSAFSIFWQMR